MGHGKPRWHRLFFYGPIVRSRDVMKQTQRQVPSSSTRACTEASDSLGHAYTRPDAFAYGFPSFPSSLNIIYPTSRLKCTSHIKSIRVERPIPPTVVEQSEQSERPRQNPRAQKASKQPKGNRSSTGGKAHCPSLAYRDLADATRHNARDSSTRLKYCDMRLSTKDPVIDFIK